jgi:hypothetical protein
MALTQKDHNFIRFLFEGTQTGKIKWEPTALAGEYTASFKGNYSVIVSQYEDVERIDWHLRLLDSFDRELLRIDYGDNSLVKDLYEQAVRAALDVDKALDEIMGEDIPF